MISQYDLGIEDVIFDWLEAIYTTIGTIALSLLVELFRIFWDYIEDLLAGYYFDNPAVILIALGMFVTAYIGIRRVRS